MERPVNQAIPVLQIDDAAEARAFYVGKLGFAVDFEQQFEPGFPMYMGMSYGDLTLHLSEHGRGHQGSEVYLYVDDIAAWVERCREHGVVVDAGPTKQPWGNTEVSLTDPSRNRLRFSQRDTH